VGQHGCKPDEERALAAILVDEAPHRIEGFPSELRRWTARRCEQLLLAALPPIVQSVLHAGAEPAIPPGALPVLAGLEARVARALEQARERLHLGDDLHLAQATLSACFMRLDELLGARAEAKRGVAREQGLQRGPASAGRVEAVGEDDTLRRDGIHVGRACDLAAHEAEVGPALIVADDQHDVGARSRLA